MGKSSSQRIGVHIEGRGLSVAFLQDVHGKKSRGELVVMGTQNQSLQALYMYMYSIAHEPDEAGIG